jgi:TATA-box binding protein (TBP) (component of TFIID and TFIIIB)
VKAVLIFSSGKIVFTGAKTREDILKAFEILKVRMIAFKSTSKNADNKEEI